MIIISVNIPYESLLLPTILNIWYIFLGYILFEFFTIYEHTHTHIYIYIYQLTLYQRLVWYEYSIVRQTIGFIRIHCLDQSDTILILCLHLVVPHDYVILFLCIEHRLSCKQDVVTLYVTYVQSEIIAVNVY